MKIISENDVYKAKVSIAAIIKENTEAVCLEAIYKYAKEHDIDQLLVMDVKTIRRALQTAEQIRKDTASEIFDKIFDIVADDEITKLAVSYGVEIEE